ncbi:MAG TPA: hypothetical protein VFQ85_09625 [Mycobacteriales bacterium]|nr:hypothetical protein [Mycobacteriales bacterium]
MWAGDDGTGAGEAAEPAAWTPADVNALLANPFYAIEIDPALAVPHPPLMDEDRWVAANVRLVEELGPEAYLRNLLSILRGNYPRADG